MVTILGRLSWDVGSVCDWCDVVSIGVERAIGYDVCRLASYFNWCSVISIGAVCDWCGICRLLRCCVVWWSVCE